MCVIFHQEPGFTLPYEYLFNAAHNNPHGYGILLKENKLIQCIKKLDPNGNDPEEIYKILKDNEDTERWVHVRNKTQGEVSELNTQPFCVYNSNKKQIWFMHNGTMPNIDYPESQLKLLGDVEVDKDASDSRKFAFLKLQPFLTRLLGEDGPADLNDPFVQEILAKFWPFTGHNRGVLVSNDQPALLFNKSAWAQVRVRVEGTESDTTFFASNDDYFERLKRGPLFEAQKKEEEEKRKAALKSQGTRTPVGELVALSSAPFSKRYGISEKVSDFFEDWNIYSPEGYIAMANMTNEEIWECFRKHPTDAALLFMTLTTYLAEATEKCQELADEKLKAQTMIAKLQKTIKKLRSNVQEEAEVHVG